MPDKVDVKLADSWRLLLEQEFSKDYFRRLVDFVKAEYAGQTVYPSGSRIFAAFDFCSFQNTKVVILGQDPYHGKGQANGLAFSVADSLPIPPSLQNIYKELEADLGVQRLVNGNLERWAKQGVLLLNSTLTVRAGAPGSHQGKGWEEFTDRVISMLSEKKQHLVFFLWGAYAQKKGSIIDSGKHLVISSAHPSPLAAHRGFFGSKPFSRANNYLKEHGIGAINW